MFARRFVKNDRAARLNTGLLNKACFDKNKYVLKVSIRYPKNKLGMRIRAKKKST